MVDINNSWEKLPLSISELTENTVLFIFKYNRTIFIGTIIRCGSFTFLTGKKMHGELAGESRARIIYV